MGNSLATVKRIVPKFKKMSNLTVNTKFATTQIKLKNIVNVNIKRNVAHFILKGH